MSATMYVLIGLPGTGKSTWVRKFLNSNEAVIVSSDDLIEAWGKERGLNYTEAFGKVNFKDIEREMRARFSAAVVAEDNIIVDRTNMTAKSRKAWMDAAGTYRKVAVVFSIDDVTHKARLEHRAATEGKVIPEHVIKNMANSYVAPSKDEGFDQIIYVRD